jgi:hypothetical protein
VVVLTCFVICECVYVCVCFVMCGCVYVWVLKRVGACRCMGFLMCRCGFCNVWLCVGTVFVLCWFFENCVGVFVMCVLVFNAFCIVCTVSFMYIYS